MGFRPGRRCTGALALLLGLLRAAGELGGTCGEEEAALGAAALEDDEGLMLVQLQRSLLAPRRRGLADVLARLEGAAGAEAGERLSYPAQVAGVNITAVTQELIPQLGACYWPEAELRDAVLLYRQRAPDAALALLEGTTGRGQHLAINVGQMYDRYDVIHSNADRILEASPGNPHALFVKALYAHAFGEAEGYRNYSDRLRQASPSAWVALDRTVGDVALAWDARAYPPYGPGALPKDWSPEKLAIVVFGCPVRDDGTPMPCLEERLNATLALAASLPEAQIIASGGAVSSRHPEGAFIRDWLVARGVDAARVFVDTAARDTLGNCIYVSGWLRANRAGNVIIVTSTWHSPRARLNLEGLLEQHSVAASIVSVGAGSADYPTQEALDARLDLERKASHRDAARARGLFTACDF